MSHDKDTGKPKGYCFIEFEHERDMHCKYIILPFQRHGKHILKNILGVKFG